MSQCYSCNPPNPGDIPSQVISGIGSTSGAVGARIMCVVRYITEYLTQLSSQNQVLMTSTINQKVSDFNLNFEQILANITAAANTIRQGNDSTVAIQTILNHLLQVVLAAIREIALRSDITKVLYIVYLLWIIAIAPSTLTPAQIEQINIYYSNGGSSLDTTNLQNLARAAANLVLDLMAIMYGNYQALFLRIFGNFYITTVSIAISQLSTTNFSSSSNATTNINNFMYDIVNSFISMFFNFYNTNSSLINSSSTTVFIFFIIVGVIYYELYLYDFYLNNSGRKTVIENNLARLSQLVNLLPRAVSAASRIIIGLAYVSMNLVNIVRPINSMPNPASISATSSTIYTKLNLSEAFRINENLIIQAQTFYFALSSIATGSNTNMQYILNWVITRLLAQPATDPQES